MDQFVWCFLLLVSITLINGDGNVTCVTGDADIVLLVDGSGSIGIANFGLVLNFLESLAMGFMVDDARIRVGFVQFNSTPKMEWDLNTHMTEAALLNAIRTVSYSNGGTATGAALNFVLANSFTPAAGNRDDVPNVIVLVTDGRSADNVTQPAQAVKDAGIEVFAVGVRNANEDELRIIASAPLDTHVFNVADFDEISNIVGNLTSNICDAVDDPPDGSPGGSPGGSPDIEDDPEEEVSPHACTHKLIVLYWQLLEGSRLVHQGQLALLCLHQQMVAKHNLMYSCTVRKCCENSPNRMERTSRSVSMLFFLLVI
ncbi:collagen alpha-1(XII) chain-like isoform X2 [Festucalex cinctus]